MGRLDVHIRHGGGEGGAGLAVLLIGVVVVAAVAAWPRLPRGVSRHLDGFGSDRLDGVAGDRLWPLRRSLVGLAGLRIRTAAHAAPRPPHASPRSSRSPRAATPGRCPHRPTGP
jgi:hypothetical protein